MENQILSGRLMPDARVPAIREFAIEIEVNPNTVVRSYLLLEDAGVIFKKRGLGYFVSPDARQIILKRNRKNFTETQLPDVIRQMKLLGIELKEFMEIYENESQSADQS